MKKERLDDVTDNRIYNIILKNEDLYCYIYVRRIDIMTLTVDLLTLGSKEENIDLGNIIKKQYKN